MKRRRQRRSAPAPWLPAEVLCAIRDALQEAVDWRSMAQTCRAWRSACTAGVALTAARDAYDAQCRRSVEVAGARLIRVAHLWRGYWFDLHDAVALCFGTRAGETLAVVHSPDAGDWDAVVAALLSIGSISVATGVFGADYRMERIRTDVEWCFRRHNDHMPDVFPIVAAALIAAVVDRVPSPQRMPLLRALLRRVAGFATRNTGGRRLRHSRRPDAPREAARLPWELQAPPVSGGSGAV